MSKEYIEREALLKDIGETVLFSVRGGAKLPTPEMRGSNKVIDRIKSAPTADVVEVVRCGEWIEQIKETIIPVELDSNGDLIVHKVIQYKCDLCGRIEGKKEPYCNCGAKMDGKGEGE